MTTPPVRPAVDPRLLAVIVDVAEDNARLLRSGADPAVRIPGATWSVGESAAHLALANLLMADLARGVERPYGNGAPAGLAAANEESLAGYPERDPLVLADAIVGPARDFAATCAARPAAEPTDTPLGPMDLGTLASYLLTHMLGHGWDLARALGRPHMLDPERVGLAVPFLLTAMPRVLNARAAAGRSARYRIVLRGGGPCFGVVLTDGAVTVSPEAPARPDCTIATEPVTFLLMALGRCSPTAAIARGRILAWGRRPWLAPAFPTYFTAP
jgi:uncharacterized protein (TIGR03083 family)